MELKDDVTTKRLLLLLLLLRCTWADNRTACEMGLSKEPQRDLAGFSCLKQPSTVQVAAICNKSQPLGATEPGNECVPIPQPYIVCPSFILPPSTSVAATPPTPNSTPKCSWSDPSCRYFRQREWKEGCEEEDRNFLHCWGEESDERWGIEIMRALTTSWVMEPCNPFATVGAWRAKVFSFSWGCKTLLFKPPQIWPSILLISVTSETRLGVKVKLNECFCLVLINAQHRRLWGAVRLESRTVNTES